MNFLMNLMLAEAQDGTTAEEALTGVDKIFQDLVRIYENKTIMSFILVCLGIVFMVWVMVKIDPFNFGFKNKMSDYYVRVDPNEYVRDINGSPNVVDRTYTRGQAPSESAYTPINQLMELRQSLKGKKSTMKANKKTAKTEKRVQRKEDRRNARNQRIDRLFEGSDAREEREWMTEMGGVTSKVSGLENGSILGAFSKPTNTYVEPKPKGTYTPPTMKKQPNIIVDEEREKRLIEKAKRIQVKMNEQQKEIARLRSELNKK